MSTNQSEYPTDHRLIPKTIVSADTGWRFDILDLSRFSDVRLV